MFTNWLTQPPAGNRSSTDDPRTENDDDTQVMEPDQGNGKSLQHHLHGGGGEMAWLCLALRFGGLDKACAALNCLEALASQLPSHYSERPI
jgi:hypothetical protein